MRLPQVTLNAVQMLAVSTLLMLTASAGRAAPADSLQHHWALDESSGTTAVDSAGSQDGTLVGGPIWRPSLGMFQGALEFDGIDDRVDLGAVDIASGPGMTITLWVRADDFDVPDARFITKATGTAEQDHYWMLSTISSTGLRFRLRAGGTTTTLATAAGELQAGLWYLVAATYDGTTMRLYKDGAEVASVAKSGSIATSGAVSAAIGDQPGGAGSKPFDGLIDDVRIYNRALSESEIAAMVPPPAPPQIVLFHGDATRWGHLGVPQTWANIQGRVQGVDRLDSLYYAVNGGAISQLNTGPDGFRLVDPGDFTIEIDHTSLSSGSNNVVITAVDTLGQRSDTTVTIDYTSGVDWNLPDTLSFSAANEIEDEAYIIDGAWQLVAGGVRTDSTATGYDRLLVAGDQTWKTNYEVIVPITIHDFDTVFPDNGPAIGVGLGWTGHDGAGQPRLEHPYQSIGFIRGLQSSPYLQLMRNGDVGVVTTPATINTGTRYMMRIRSDSTAATTSRVRMRVWEDGTPEPSGWDLDASFVTRDGSVILIAHRADVTFGDTIIQPLEHVLTIATVGGGSVTRDPDLGVYPDSTEVELTATPDAGWVFDSWSGGLSGAQNPDTLLLTSSTSVTATFTSIPYTITTNTVGGGAVVRTPDEPSYTYGDTVLVQAVPDGGWEFSSWSGGLSGSQNPDTIVVTADTSVTATFTAAQLYAIATATVGNGSVALTPDLEGYPAGDTVLVSGVPDPGWSFDSWSGALSGSENPDTIIAAQDTTVTATFTQDSYTLTRSATGMGAVLVAPNQASYLYGDTLVLTATPFAGWEFDSWTAGLSGSLNPDTLFIQSDTTVTALFTPAQYTVSVSTVGNGTVTKTPDSTSYAFGDTVILSATPDLHWGFSGWSGGLSGAQNPDTIVVASDTSVTATFTSLGFIISTSVVGAGDIVIEPAQAYYDTGDTVVLTAVPNPGWNFLGWSGGLSGTENPDTIVVVSDSSFTATFGTEIVSDDFNYSALDTTVWRWWDPIGDATLVFSGTNAIVDVPGGISHDLWSDCNCAPRLLQSAPDTDFQIEAKFDSRGTRTYQAQGLVVHQDDDTYIRFDIVFWSGNPFLYAAFVDGGSVTTKLNTSLSGNRPYLRVTRSGDAWTFEHSGDGSSWTSAGSFSQAMTVTEVGLSMINDNVTASSTPDYVASVDYFFDSSNPISPEDGGAPNAPTPPVVVVWQGDTQYADLGTPQHWYNVVGRVWDVDAIDSLRVAVNGGAVRPLNLGPDGFRLVGVNDFVAEIPYGDLVDGVNDIVFTAIDTLGERTDHPVTLNYTSDVLWSMPDTLDFTGATRVDDEAYVLDGRWLLTGAGVRTDSTDTGYDRLLAMGDTLWPTDYEVVTPLTIYASDLGAPGGIGIGVGWQGHEGAGQPRLDPPYQTIAFIRKVTTTPELQLLSAGDVIEDAALVPITLGTTYWLKLRSESIGAGLSHARARIWEDGTPEPSTWDVEADFTTRRGSALLIAHKSDVEFGTTTVTPLPVFPQHALDVVTVGAGTVDISPPADTTLGLYPDSTTVTLTAQADSGWVFTGWSGALSGTATTDSLLLVDDAVVTATFRQSAVLVADVVGSGTIDVQPDTSYFVGDTLVVSAIPDPGWSFGGWSGELVGNQTPDTLLLASDTTSITATFTQDQYAITTSVAGNGSILVEPDSSTFLYGDTVVVTALPDTNWAFTGWSGGLSGLENPDTIVVASDTSITATFEQVGFSIATSIVGNGAIVFAPDTSVFALGDTVLVTALPDPGWSFDSWSGGLTGLENPDTIIVATDTSITATFTRDQYTIATSVAGNGSILIEPDSSTFVYGDTVVVTALPDTNWAFSGWSGGLSGLENPDTIIVASDTSLTATFEQVEFSIATAVNGNGAIELLPDTTTYGLGDTVIVTALPAPGWRFDSWSGGLSGTENPDTIVVASDTSITATFTQDQYVITTSVVGNGSILVEPDSSTFVYGDTVVVTALPDTNWAFSGWSGGLSGVENPDTIVVASDTSITATFAQVGFAIATSVIGNGTIELTPDTTTYALGDTVVVTAVPDPGWIFAAWSGGLTGSVNPDTIIVAADTSIIAAFAQVEFTIATSVIGSGSIDVQPDSATYAFGDTVVVTALPDPGWSFDSWSGGLSGLENPDTIIVASDTSLTATFTQDQYVITPSVVGNGSILVDPDSSTFVYGDTVVVTAVPDTNWAFTGWSGGLSGIENPDTIVVASDTSITATFEQVGFVIATSVIGNGTIELVPDTTTYALGDTVIVTAVPDSNWAFSAWSDGLTGSVNPDTIIVASDTSITATFMQVEFTVATNIVGSGSIDVQPDSATYAFGDTVVVTAVPGPGWSFDSWSGGLSGTVNPDTIIVASDTSITATFTQDQYVITTSVVGNGSILVDPDSSTYGYGDTVVVTAVPDTNWAFSGWSGGLSGFENPDTIVVASDTSITATFEQVGFVIATSVIGNGAIELVPDTTTYALGDTVVVTAVPDPGWIFAAWSGGLTGSVNPDTIVVAADTSIIAAFAAMQFTVTSGAIGSGTVELVPDQATYAYGDTIVATAVPDSGWMFVEWTAGLSGSVNPDTVVVTSDTTVTASFAQTQVTLTRITVGSGSILAVPDQAGYAVGDTVVLSAAPDTGWAFGGWSGALTGADNPDTLILSVDTTVTATFVPIEYTIDITITGNGQVERTPDQPTYAYGDTVVLTAVPDSAWAFEDWSGDLTGVENPDTVVIDSSLAITATFKLKPTSADGSSVPRFVSMQQNFPNPFGHGTTIRYGLPTDERATLEVYDVRGRLVLRRDLPSRGAGWHEYRLDAVDSRGRELPAGVYFYRLRSAGTTATRKMIIVR